MSKESKEIPKVIRPRARRLMEAIGIEVNYRLSKDSRKRQGPTLPATISAASERVCQWKLSIS